MNRRSLSRVLRAAALCALVPSFPCFAEAETLVITGSREPLSPERLAADVVVIDSDTIRASSADSLADLLRREAGVQLSRSGGPGQATGIFVRGASTSQVVVLVDGVRIGSATLGSVALEGLDLAQIDRIEVLRGPGSSLYGADAMGGVVQIFTRRGAAGARFDASVAAGGYGSSALSAGASGATGTWDAAASASLERSVGRSALRPNDQFGNYNPDNDGFRRSSVQAQLGFTPVAGQRLGLALVQAHLNAQYDGSQYLPPDYRQDSSPDFRTRQSTEVAALDWRGRLNAALSASARASRSVDDSSDGADAPEHYRTAREQLAAQLAWRTGALGQLVVAVEHDRDTAQASVFLADVARRTTALVASLTGDAGPWSWQTEVRRDDSSDFGAATTARIGGALRLSPALRLRALTGTSFRAPSFNDLYYPGYGIRPDNGEVPALQPEKGRSVEIGLDWRDGDSAAAATVYRNRMHDLIAYEGDRSFCPSDPAYDFGCARNIDRAKLDGATLSGRQRLGAWALKAQLDFLAAHDAATGARLSRRAAHQETLGADWDSGPWSAGASVLRVGARPDAGKVLGAETTLDLQGNWRFAKGWALTAKLLNATNRETEPARDYQGLGRQAWLGLRFDGGL